MTDIAISFKNCRNCGKYLQEQLKKNRNLCSEECSLSYSTCKTCGTYFLRKNPENHYCSVRCRMLFNLNKSGYPYIKTTPYKLVITGNPVINIELIATRLALVLKLPLLMTEQIKISNKLTAENVIDKISGLKETENNGEFFLLLCNSYEIDFIREFNSKFDIDMIIDIKRKKNSQETEPNLRCDKCSNINTFSDPDAEKKRKCLICGNNVYKKVENITAVKTKERNYYEITEYLEASFPDKYFRFTGETIRKTVNVITASLVYDM